VEYLTILSVIKLLGFFVIFSVKRDFYTKTARIGVNMALCLSIGNAMSCIILAKFRSM